MEHLLHIAVKHFVEAVAPASPMSIQKKVKVALKKAQDEGQLNLNQFNNTLTALDLDDIGDPLDDGGNSEDDDAEFTSGDSLSKALALVKQV
jgi:hypothetical protein